jgi:tetratricopeptide (TPR) repeat protein
MQDKTMALYRQARMNLEQSIRLLPSCDSFLFYYVKLLVFNEEYDVALDALERFRDISPNHPNAYRYLARFYEFYFPDKTQQRLHALRKWIELDPNNDEAFYQLTTFYENGMISLNEIIDITINRIDYNVDDVTLWRFFISLLFNKISSSAQPENRNYIIHDNSASVEEELYRSNVLNESDENEWMKKLHWWRESLLFPSTRQINTNIPGDEILCLRGLCSLLLFGRKNNRSYYLILRHFESQNQLNKIEEIFSQFGISILPCELQMCTSAEMENSSDETEDNNNGPHNK